MIGMIQVFIAIISIHLMKGESLDQMIREHFPTEKVIINSFSPEGSCDALRLQVEATIARKKNS